MNFDIFMALRVAIIFMAGCVCMFASLLLPWVIIGYIVGEKG